ncbi:unnamed protein product [Rhizophagus irregularis]|uniref:Uncharacterized protein n=1 Tax=Rhizophagus irregularis TaxID=588596 RepID=A0A915ZMV2_9GLOM|nr:unnamed protein product [Rhizophagus irregularis]
MTHYTHPTYIKFFPFGIQLKRLRTFVFLREHLPGTGFWLEDFGFLDYLGYWILSSRVLYFVFPGSL